MRTGYRYASSPTIGSRGICDEPYIQLMAGVLRQAALDYKSADDWLREHTDEDFPQLYKKMESLKKDVESFTRSNLFDYAVGDTITPETFLKMALTVPIRLNRV